MDPAQQTSEWLTQVNQFFTNLREAGPLIGLIGLLIIAAIVYAITRFFDYRWRVMLAKQEAIHDQNLGAALGLVSTSERAIENMRTGFIDAIGMLRKEFAETVQTRHSEVDQWHARFTSIFEQSNAILQGLVTSSQSIESMLNAGTPALQKLSENIQAQQVTADKSLKAILAKLDAMHSMLEEVKVTIHQQFPRYSEMDTRVETIEKEVEQLKAECVETVKKATGEHEAANEPEENGGKAA